MTLQDELEHKEQWKKLSQKELDDILDRHENFANGQRDGERAQLGMHDLSYLDMAGRNLSRAELTGAILSHCNLEGAKMDDIILFAADLRFTNMADARLNHADLRGACLAGANLSGAMMNDVDMRDVFHGRLRNSHWRPVRQHRKTLKGLTFERIRAV